jgi:hypothetical protein
MAAIAVSIKMSPKAAGALYMKNIKQEERIAELEKERITLLSCLLDISDGCIGKVTMNYNLDAQSIGESIYVATDKTNPELTQALKEQIK